MRIINFLRSKNKIKIAFILCIFILSCQKENDKPEDKLDKVLLSFSNKSSIDYNLNYRIKYFDYPDTTKISARTIIIKEKTDSLFGGYIWYSRKDSTSDYIKYYDLNSFYIINNKNEEVIRYNPEKPIPYGFTNNFDGKLLKTYFLQHETLKEQIQDSINKSKIAIENGFLRLTLVYPDGDELINQKREILFDTSQNTVKQIIYTAELDKLQEYNEWNLNDIHFDSYNREDLEKKFKKITKDYKFIEYQPPSKEEILPLAKGQKAQSFKGNYLTKSKLEFDLANFSDNIIILDFWYKTCPPCIKSIPQLNRIYNKYKSQGVKLFGVNDIDTDSLSRKQLIPFVKRENIKYPIVLIDKSVSQNYKVRGYPTFYIINKSGNIEYSKLGYSENMEQEVDSILNKILK